MFLRLGSTLILCTLFVLPLFLSANPGKGKGPPAAVAGSVPDINSSLSKKQKRAHLIRRDLKVWGGGWFDGPLTLSGMVGRLVMDPEGGLIEWETFNGLESLWFEPGFVGLSGGLALGYTEEPWAGIIRWTGQDFEGFDGFGWVSLTGDSGPVSPPPPPGPPNPPISPEQVMAWDRAYSWGDHRGESYLREESDPVFAGSPAAGLTSMDLANLAAAYQWGNHSLAGYLTQETDPHFVASPASAVSVAQIDRWEEAHGWGDHQAKGYLRAESDPAVQSSGDGALPYWDGEALRDAPMHWKEEGLQLATDTFVAGNLAVEGEAMIQKLPRQGDIFMGPFGRPEDAGPGN
ncbi:MAG: hypothetical protein WD490_06340 [Opitutales bacterium]